MHPQHHLVVTVVLIIIMITFMIMIIIVIFVPNIMAKWREFVSFQFLQAFQFIVFPLFPMRAVFKVKMPIS